MATSHQTTVTPASNGNFTLACTCGESVTYNGESFTKIEAQRHEAWHAKVGR